MQILATGANGQVGWELACQGPEYGFDTIALNRSSLDVCDFQAVKNVINNSDAAMVINAVAYTNVDRAESEPEIAFISFAIEEILPITTEEYPLPAKRPANSVFDCTCISKKFGIYPKPWQDSLLAMIKQLAGRNGIGPR